MLLEIAEELIAVSRRRHRRSDVAEATAPERRRNADQGGPAKGLVVGDRRGGIHSLCRPYHAFPLLTVIETRRQGATSSHSWPPPLKLTLPASRPSHCSPACYRLRRSPWLERFWISDSRRVVQWQRRTADKQSAIRR